MLLLIGFATFLGFYFLYLTSRRAAVSRLVLRTWAKNNVAKSKALGGFLVGASWIMYMLEIGFGAGLFYALVTLMAAASLSVILLPLQWRPHKTDK